MKLFNIVFTICVFNFLYACSKNPTYISANPDDDQQTPIVEDYQPIALTSNAKGKFEVSESSLSIELDGKEATYGVCLPSLKKGHFVAEIKSDKKTNFGIAIVQEKNGKPDFNNYTSVSVCLENGVPIVRVLDRQNGVDNVLDNTNKINKNDFSRRYSISLNNSYFSVPYHETTGRAKIIRNNISGFFHFYIGVGKEINGVFYENWLELAQSKDWSGKNQNFFVCPIVRNTTDGSSKIKFSDIIFDEFSSEDSNEQTQMFSVSQREFIWAGFKGDAAIVNFDPKYCPAAEDNKKFVFWSEMNYVPAWCMNNELLYSYEFAETWSSLNKGCFEPMSDRLLAYTKVDIIEDNKVRKVIRYNYALINPDYKTPYPNGEYPEVNEYYTFYPDGVGVRRIEYIQKQSGKNYFKYHELSEPLIVAGSSSVPSDHVKAPALTISNLSGAKYNLYPDKPFNEVNSNVKNWTEQIYTVHLKNSPDAFSVFSYTKERPEVSPLPIENDLTWHDVNYQMSHWPVDKQPYLNVPNGDYDKSFATWPTQVSHSSLIGIEAKGDISWNSSYEVNSDGNKYRVYLMLFGINQPEKFGDIDSYTRAWLYMGEPNNLKGLSYDSSLTGYSKREIIFTKIDSEDNCTFTFNPLGIVKNPVIRIDNWSGNSDVKVKEGGNILSNGDDFLCDKIGDSLVLWFNFVKSSSFTLEIIPE